MKLDPKENRFRRLAVSIVSRLLASVVALSFFAILVPVGTASAENETIMACCVGKKAGHCHSGLGSKKSAQEHDHNTVVAEEDQSASSAPAFRSAVRNSCHSDCCACLASSRQQKREPGTAQVARRHSPYKIFSHHTARTALFSSTEIWAQISPRGPPLL